MKRDLYRVQILLAETFQHCKEIRNLSQEFQPCIPALIQNCFLPIPIIRIGMGSVILETGIDPVKLE